MVDGLCRRHGCRHILKGFVDLERGPSLSALDEAPAMDVLLACSRAPLQQSA
jgi:hypothetical protein